MKIDQVVNSLPVQSVSFHLQPAGLAGWLGCFPNADVLPLARLKSGDTQELDLWVTIAKKGIKRRSDQYKERLSA